MTTLLERAPLTPQHQTVRRPLFTATTTSQALYLPIAPPTLGTAGAVIGRELYSGKAFVYCPFSAFGDGLPGGNMIVMGDTGRGKSALTKTYAARQIRLGRQVVVLDTKEQAEREEGEWAALGRSLTGAGPVKFTPGGGHGSACINPMDPAISGKRQTELVRTIVELGLGKPLDEFAGSALRIAIRQAHHRAAQRERAPVLADVAAALRAPDEADASGKRRTQAELLADGLEASYVLDRLCGSDEDTSGDLTGMQSHRCHLQERTGRHWCASARPAPNSTSCVGAHLQAIQSFHTTRKRTFLFLRSEQAMERMDSSHGPTVRGK